MRQFIQELVVEISHYLEIFLSVILSITMIFFAFGLIKDIPGFFSVQIDNDKLFQVVLGRAMTLAVGVELIKMLSKPSPSTVIEVLLFALTRQIIVDHPRMLDFLIGVIAVAVLFAIRRYLFVNFDDSSRMIVRANQKVKMINFIAHIKLPVNGNETLREFVSRRLTENNKTISEGAVVYQKHVALRIDKMNGELISRVEIIKNIY